MTTTPTPATPSVSATLPALQSRVREWTLDCFGDEIACDMQERMDRFTEEALELAQSLGYDADRAHALVNYVFGRDKGEPSQEVGGTMTTLAALCNVAEIDILTAFAAEVARITQPEMVLKIRAKQAAKPTGSALPVATPSVSVESEEALTFTYTNWRGETAVRRVIAGTARFRFGSTKWHPELGWLLYAIDLDKMEGRDFAVRDIVFAPAPNPSPAAKSGEARVAAALDAFCLNPDGSRLTLDDPIAISFQSQLRRMRAALAAAAALATPSPQPADAVREADIGRQYLTRLLRNAEFEQSHLPSAEAALPYLRRMVPALTEPAPAGEAVEPVAYQQRNRLDGVWSDWYPSSKKAFEESEAGPVACYEVRPLYAHPAPEDTARLREDLEQAKRDRDMFSDWFKAERQEKIAVERERDDARKALETVANSLDSALSDVRYQPGDHPVVPIKHDTFVGAVRLIASAARSASREATR